MVRKNCQNGRKYPSQTRYTIRIITIYQIKRATSDYTGVNEERRIQKDGLNMGFSVQTSTRRETMGTIFYKFFNTVKR